MKNSYAPSAAVIKWIIASYLLSLSCTLDQPVSSRIACHTFSLQCDFAHMTPLSWIITTGTSDVSAISTKIFSKAICRLIRLMENKTASFCDNSCIVELLNALPYMRMVAISGTCKTRYPRCIKVWEIEAIAVVFPAHGPPVTTMRVIDTASYFLIRPPNSSSTTLTWRASS